MENNSTPPSDFEKLLRDQLQKVDATPDDNTWDRIAASQMRGNVWLRVRYLAKFIIPAVIILTIAGISWHRLASSGATPDTTDPAQQQAGQEPIANVSTETQTATHPEPRLIMGPRAVKDGLNQRLGARVSSVPAAVLSFQASLGIQYQNPVSGTQLRIPPNSLVDARGVPVQGTVDLLFREYRGIGDFLASDIPMHYGDSRGDFFFNSGGMFEVRISQNAETLQMAPGQTYDLTFVPTDRLTNPSLFYLDETKGAWRFQPDGAFAGQTGALPVPVSEDIAAGDNTDGKKGPECLPALITEVSPFYLQSGIKTGWELANGKLSMPAWFRKNPGLTDERLLNGLDKGLIRIVRDRDKEEQLFPEDLNDVYTELKAFKNGYFIRRVDSLAHSNLTSKLPAEKYWERIYIVQEPGNTCRITLYTRDDKVEFYADLVPSPGVATFNIDDIMAEYRRLRNQRQQVNLALAGQLRRFLFAAPMLQTPEEWCMSDVQWLEYFNNNLPLMKERYRRVMDAGWSTDEAVINAALADWNNRLVGLYSKVRSKQKSVANLEYTLKLSSFGVYNCDQIFRLSAGAEQIYVDAAYRLPNGQSVYPSSASVLDRNTRMFFTLSDPGQLLFAPGRRLDIILKDKHGRCYLLSREQYSAIKLPAGKEETQTLVVQDVTDETQSPDAWANLLEI